MSTTPKKETIRVNKESSFPCPDKTHPLFTIRVTKDKPGICYYCSKLFIYEDEDDYYYPGSDCQE